MREEIARLVFRVWFNSDLYEFNTAGGEIQHKCYVCADQILAITKVEEVKELPKNPYGRFQENTRLGYKEAQQDILKLCGGKIYRKKEEK